MNANKKTHKDILSEHLTRLDTILNGSKFNLPDDTYFEIDRLCSNTQEAMAVLPVMPLVSISRYDLPGDFWIERTTKLEDASEKWAIRNQFRQCIGKDGNIHDEPSPSNRTEEFFEQCRWSSVEEAYAFWDTNVKPKQNKNMRP